MTSLMRRQTRQEAPNTIEVLERGTALSIFKDRGAATIKHHQLREVERFTAEAMTGQAMLVQWAGMLAGSDPMAYDELMGMVKLARFAKSELLVDMVAGYSRGK